MCDHDDEKKHCLLIKAAGSINIIDLQNVRSLYAFKYLLNKTQTFQKIRTREPEWVCQFRDSKRWFQVENTFLYAMQMHCIAKANEVPST